MSGIDYSKWDKFECSSSDSSNASNDSFRDEENDDNSTHDHRSGNERGAPKVTRLEYPTRVTLGPSGVQLVKAPPKASSTPFHLFSQPPREEHAVDDHPTAAIQGSEQLCAVQHLAHSNEDVTGLECHNDDEDLLYESLVRNGSREGTEHWWAQTEDSVTVSFLVPWETTAKTVTDFKLREVKDETSDQYRAQLEITIEAPAHLGAGALTSEDKGIKVAGSSSVFHICKQFRYPIKLAEELLEGCWQLLRMPQRRIRLLVVEVFKEPVGQGMTLWWDRCFVSDTLSVIDTQNIPDRVQRVGASGASTQEKAERLRKVWNEAHEEFRRRMATRKAAQI